MVKCVCVVWLMLVSAASAGTSWIELVPETPGPYAPGVSVDVDVLLHNMEGQEIRIRLISLDFVATDARLGLPEYFEFEWGPCCSHIWKYYNQFQGMPKVDLVYNSPRPGWMMFDIADGESWLVGMLAVGLPDDPGTYVLDAMNGAAPDIHAGARVDYGFEPRIILHAVNGNLTGGQLAMTVVPEPVTMVLIMVGGFGWVACRSRRACPKRWACQQSP